MLTLRPGILAIAALLGVAGASGAHAATLPVYSNQGMENPFQYSFVAKGGAITGYYLGTGAGYSETLGLKVNGQTIASGVFANHGTALGTAYDFGSFAAGTRLTFFIDVQQNAQTFYSDTTLNQDGANHVYATAFAGQGNVPSGTYIGFEDLSANRSQAPNQAYDVDYNYTDEQFAVTNVLVSTVPLPASAPLFGAALLGLAGLGYVAKRKKAVIAA